MSPAPIENRINAHPLIEACMVSGLGQPAPYALLILSDHVRPKQNDAAVRSELEKELANMLAQVNGELVGYERLQTLVVTQEPWSIESGMLTPTMKIKRSRMEGAVTDTVEAWFAGAKKVNWA